MRDHHRGIAVVRVQHLQVRRGGANPLEQPANRTHVDLRCRRGSESDRLIAEEVRRTSATTPSTGRNFGLPYIGSMQNEQPLLTYRTHPLDVSSSTVSGSGKSGWARITSAPRSAQRSHSSTVRSRWVHSPVRSQSKTAVSMS